MSTWRTLWQSSNIRRRFPLRTCPRILPSRPRHLHTISVDAADLSFGQPLHETHPHILSPGELTPGITSAEYAERRTNLAQKLPKDAIAVVAASDIQFRTGNVFYEFHQDPDFLYLTGFNEPEALAIIGKDKSGTDHTFHLYVREKDPKAEIWDGARSGTQAAIDVFNADHTGNITSLKKALPEVIRSAKEVYTDITQPDKNTSALKRFLYGQSKKQTEFAQLLSDTKLSPLRPLMNDLRAWKTPAEIAVMRYAGRASGRAHTDTMRKSWTKEKELDAYLRYRFLAHGCDTLAFEPVIAGGKNALSIHYIRNDDVLQDDDMVLADAAGKYAGYISDITRTWPVSGKFSDPQRDLYQAVLNVQRSLISLCRESASVTLDKLHAIAEDQLREQLVQIGFDNLKREPKLVEILFPHHVSHYIGMDLHDTNGYSRKTTLREGHCITVEPGIYVPDDDRWPEHFRGMGVRIEDSVSIGLESPYVLTTEAVKEIVDIEALRD